MKLRILFVGLLLSGGVILTGLDAQSPKDAKDKAKKVEAKDEITDITAKVREINSAKFASPPAEFRVGSVNPHKLDAKAITKTKTGFEIKLPSGAPIPTPTLYKGKLYVSGGFSTREYFCFDAATGQFVWGMNLDDDGPTSAVCSDDIVVFNTESCTIFALDARTGKHLWSHFLGDPLTSTPTIANGKVFTSYPATGDAGQLQSNFKPSPDQQQPGGNPKKKQDAPKQSQEKAKPRPNVSHAMICLDLKTGKILWQKWIDSDVMSAPVAVDDEVYATTFSGTVYKFKQKDGTILSALKSRATCAPVIVGNDVFWTQRADRRQGESAAEEIAGNDRGSGSQRFSSARRDAIYLDPKTQEKSALGKAGQKLDEANALGGDAGGKAGWGNIGQGSVSTMQAFQGSRILHYKNANYNCMGDELVNTDPSDGKVRWKVKLKGDLAKQGGHLAAPPAVAGGQLFLTTVEGEVLQVDPDKGNVTKTYKVGAPIRSQAAIEGGRIYVGTQDGKVVCIDTGDARFTGWYTWGANMAHTNTVELFTK